MQSLNKRDCAAGLGIICRGERQTSEPGQSKNQTLLRQTLSESKSDQESTGHLGKKQMASVNFTHIYQGHLHYILTSITYPVCFVATLCKLMTHIEMACHGESFHATAIRITQQQLTGAPYDRDHQHAMLLHKLYHQRAPPPPGLYLI